LRLIAFAVCAAALFSCGPEASAKRYLTLLRDGQMEEAEALLEPATASYVGQEGLKGTYPDLVAPGLIDTVKVNGDRALVVRTDTAQGKQEAEGARGILGDLLHNLVVRKTADGWRILDCAAVGYLFIKQVGTKDFERAQTGVTLLKDARCDDKLVPKLEAWMLAEHGNAYYDQGVYEKATECLQRSLQLEPSAGVHYTLGFVYRDNKAITNNFSRAIDEFSAAIALDPSNGEYHSALANVYLRSDNYDGSISEYEAALKLAQTNIQARYFYAKALFLKERPADAAVQMGIVVAVDPNYRDAAKLLQSIRDYQANQARRASIARYYSGY
jgi:tetratricopeptide (TPR) repeat protein